MSEHPTTLSVPHPSAGETSPTLERLRSAAASLFAERGYAGASMSEIASRVGIRKASLYNYYRSKQELLSDLLEQSLGDWQEACWPPVEGDGGFEERLRRHLEAAVEFAADHPQKVAMVRVAATQIGGDFGRQIMLGLEERRLRYIERLAAHFEEAIAAGEIDARGLGDDEPEVLASAFRSFLDGLLTNLIFCPSPGACPFEARVPEMWTVLWRGLSGRLPSGAGERR